MESLPNYYDRFKLHNRATKVRFKRANQIRFLQRVCKCLFWKLIHRPELLETYNQYKLEDIQVGDLVYFIESPGKSNYDEYWEVTGINHAKSQIEIKLNFLNEDWFTNISLSEIKQLLPIKKVKNRSIL